MRAGPALRLAQFVLMYSGIRLVVMRLSMDQKYAQARYRLIILLRGGYNYVFQEATWRRSLQLCNHGLDGYW